jgi:hypothetical protein
MLKFIHSINRLLWLSNEERLATRGVDMRVFDIGKMQGANSSTVDQ